MKTTYHFSDRWFGGTDLYWQYNNHTFRGYYAVFAGLHEELADCVRVDAVVRYGYNGGYVGPVVHHGSNALDYNLSFTFRATDVYKRQALDRSTGLVEDQAASAGFDARGNL